MRTFSTPQQKGRLAFLASDTDGAMGVLGVFVDILDTFPHSSHIS